MARSKRRQKRYEKIDTSDFELQGGGTWVKVSPKTKVAHYQLAIEAGRLFMDDKDSVKPIDKDDIDLDALADNMSTRERTNNEAIRIYKERLPGIVLDWNWATDIEVDIETISGNQIILSEYLLEDTMMPVTNDFMVKNFSNFRVFLGKYPETYETYQASFDGFKTITINEKLRRNYVPNDDYLVLGYPSPKSPKTYELLSDNEVIGLGSKIYAVYLLRVGAINAKHEEKKRD